MTTKKMLNLYDNETVKWTSDGKMYCLHIRMDDVAFNPRENDDGLLTIMACWHRHYKLGDKVEASSPEEFWQKLVRENVNKKEAFDAIAAGKLYGIRVVPNPENSELVDIYETTQLVTPFGSSDPSENLEYEGVCKDAVLEWILDELTIEHCMILMEPHAEWLPLWLYDHSGITMSCGSRTGQYADPWDSGQVGWIIALKSDVMKNCIDYVLDENGERIQEKRFRPDGSFYWAYKLEHLTDATWRSRAIEMMTAEVEVYDQYLTGEVYGYILYEAEIPADGEDPDWEEIDSCWGFYGSDVQENGMIENIGNGLEDAINSDEYKTGEAKLVTYSYYVF